MKFLNFLSVPQRFLLLFVSLVLLSALMTRTFFVRQERSDLEMRLQEKATFINKTYALSIAAALLQNDDIMLLQVVNALEDDQEISSVIVVDQRNEIRYHVDAHKIGFVLDDNLVKTALKNGEAILVPYRNAGGKAMALISPLKIPSLARPLGAVRIDLTYRRVEGQLAASQQHYWFIVLGTLVTCGGFVILCMHNWIVTPLQRLRDALAAINTAMPEPNLSQGSDDFGKTFAAVNDLVARFKMEFQQQWSQQQGRAELEKAWVRRLVESFLPEARVIIADKDNRILSDSGNGLPGTTVRRHLMELIKDANFATLLSNAFQKEGEVVRGPVTFQNTNYQAAILSVPIQQSMVVKTLIALQSK